MTDPKVLADALVKAGIGQRRMDGDYGLLNWDYPNTVPSHRFITDWRVAGKVLESMVSFDADATDEWTISVWLNGAFTGPSATAGNESLPRAIIEVWYAATEHGDT